MNVLTVPGHPSLIKGMAICCPELSKCYKNGVIILGTEDGKLAAKMRCQNTNNGSGYTLFPRYCPYCGAVIEIAEYEEKS